TYVAEDHPAPPGVPAPAASLRITTPGYFRAMGIPLIEGRDFDAGTDGETAGIINERMARELWPGESAIGKRINLWSPDGPEFTVVGVVGTVRQQRVDTEGTPEMYLPHERFTSPTMTFTVRTAGAPAQMIPELKQAVWSVDDDIPISEIATMEEVVRHSLADSQFFAGLLAAFGILALGLGALGVYGVLAYSVSERRHEIGVRIALGATRGTVQRWVVGRGLLPVGLGLGLGMLTSLWATRLLAAHLYQVGARDLSIFGGVALTLLVVALLATWLPARRASRIDPIQALRAE
ncbi:MAG: FtsX-like permease family protein, partial [Gemmatimonadales bacterium]